MRLVHVKVVKLREQCQKQEETIREQETELDSKRGELQKLKDEESSLEREYEDNKRKLDKLSKSLQDTQLQICQVCDQNATASPERRIKYRKTIEKQVELKPKEIAPNLNKTNSPITETKLCSSVCVCIYINALRKL